MAVNRAYLFGDVPVLGPIGVPVTGVSNSAVPAIGSDFVRHGILFHNPNPNTILRIAPDTQTLAAGGGIPLNPYSSWAMYDSLGGETGNSNALIRVNCGWLVRADDVGSFGLTIWNFTDDNQSVPAPLPIAYQNVDVDIPSPNFSQTALLTTASSMFLPAYQNRRGIVFSNPGTKLKAVAPANLAASFGAGSIIILPSGEQRIEARGKVRVNCGFTAVTEDNTDGTLTALEFA